MRSLLTKRCLALFSGYIAASLIFVRPEAATAYELASEYRSLDREEASAFDNPRLIDAEYQSDYLFFLPHLRETSHLSGNYWNATVGSLGAKDFMVRDDLRMRAPLGNDVHFQLRHFYVNDFEDVSRHFVYEFAKYFGEHKENGMAIFGEPTGEKEDVDFGVAFILRRWVRLYFHWPDFQRNHRNDEADKFKDSPFVTGVKTVRREGCNQKSEESESCRLITQMNLRLEAEAVWDLPQDETIYTFSRSLWSYWRREANEDIYLNFRFEWLRKREERLPTTIMTTDEQWISERYMTDASVEFGDFEPGAMVTYRKWERGLAASGTRNWDTLTAVYTQPYIWWRVRSHWRLGTELTIGDVDGEIVSIKEPLSTTEARINLEWSRAITKNGGITALFSFDGDELFTSEAWEGGNLRMNLEF